MKRALFIMAKEPVPGEVKTRLCPPLTPTEAADFYRCFLLDALAAAQSLAEQEELRPLDLFVAYHPKEAEDFFRALAPPVFRLFPQEGEGLSARLINGFGRLFAQGYSTVAALSSDSPTLNPQKLVEGFLLLEEDPPRYALSIKPCVDGGYCFLAMNQFHPRIFEGIEWSSEQVFAQTKQKAAGLGLAWFKMQTWYDIDTVEDFIYLEEILKYEQKNQLPWPAGRRTLEFFNNYLRARLDRERTEGW